MPKTVGGYDAIEPNWRAATPVHDWRNYISEDLKAMWGTFTDEQKVAIAENAYNLAGAEDYE